MIRVCGHVTGSAAMGCSWAKCLRVELQDFLALEFEVARVQVAGALQLRTRTPRPRE
jgi:hypothetical protein